MTHRAPGRKSSLVGLTAIALVVFSALAPSAFAQLDTSQIPSTSDSIGTVTDTVTDTTDTVTDTTEPVTDTVTDTTDPVTGTTDPITDTVKDTTGEVGGVVDETGKTVDDTTETTTYSDAKKSVDNTTGGTGTTVIGTIDDTTESVTNPLLNVKDADGDGKISKAERNFDGVSEKGAASGGDFAGHTARDRGKLAALSAAEKSSRKGFAPISTLVEAPQRESFFDQLAQAAGDAVQKLAFPLGLALMVGAFLIVQGRIDRKDAKLALAPIDSEQDLLSFQ